MSTDHCSQCGKAWRSKASLPEAVQSWCSPTCRDAWYAARPEEAAKWADVRDLTIVQRAELDAILGNGGKA